MGHGVFYFPVSQFSREPNRGKLLETEIQGRGQCGFFILTENVDLWRCYCGSSATALPVFVIFVLLSFVSSYLILANPAPEATSLALSFYFYTLVSGPNE